MDCTSEKKIHEMFSKRMWTECPDEALEIFQMYLFLRNDFDSWRMIGQDCFLKKYNDKKSIWYNKLQEGSTPFELHEYRSLDNDSLIQMMMLLRSDRLDHWEIIKNVGPKIWSVLFRDSLRIDDIREPNFELEACYISWLAKYIYHAIPEIRNEMISEIKSCIYISREFENFLSTIIFEQDKFQKNLVFWKIWNGFYPRIVELLTNKSVQKRRQDVMEVLPTYCLAWDYWKKDIKEWNGFKTQNLEFFEKTVEDLGFLPETLFSVSKFIYTIGYQFIDEGVVWTSKIISKNEHLIDSKFPINTEFYLEEMVLRFTKEFEEKARKVPLYRKSLLNILNFLVLRGSNIGFFIREEIF